MAWFMITKVVPQHQETPASLLKPPSVFCIRGIKQRNISDQHNGLERELGPDTGVYCFALVRSPSPSIETDTKYNHTHSATTCIF